MKSKIKIITIILILATTMGLLSGCTKTLDNSEGLAIIANGIQNSLERDSYYIKYLDKTKNIVNYINYQEDKNAMLAQFGHTEADTFISDRTLYYFGTTLKTKVGKGATTSEEAPLTDIVAKHADLQMTTILANITNLTAEDISYDIKGSGVWTKGKVTYIVLKVINPNNLLSNYSGIEINIINDKINLIRSIDETLRIDVMYQGPVIKSTFDIEK